MLVPAPLFVPSMPRLARSCLGQGQCWRRKATFPAHLTPACVTPTALLGPTAARPMTTGQGDSGSETAAAKKRLQQELTFCSGVKRTAKQKPQKALKTKQNPNKTAERLPWRERGDTFPGEPHGRLWKTCMWHFLESCPTENVRVPGLPTGKGASKQGKKYSF